MKLKLLSIIFFLGLAECMFAAQPSLEMPHPRPLLRLLPEAIPAPEPPQGQFQGGGGGLNGCTTPSAGQLNCTGSLTLGSGASAAGATATGGFAAVEAASTGWTPTATQDYCRADSTLHNFVCALNGAAEVPQILGTCATANALSIFTAASTEGCGNADFTYVTHTLTAAATGLVDLSAQSGVNSFKVPLAANGGVTAVGGAFGYNTSEGDYNAGSNGNGVYRFAVANTSGAGGTTCVNQVFTAIYSTLGPTCSSLSAFVTSDYTNATTTLSNVTGLAVTLAANTNYAVSCKLIYQGSVTTASMVLSSTGPASPTKISTQNTQTTTSGAGAAMYSDASDGTSFAFTLGPAAIVSTAVDLPSTLDIGIMNGANAGTFQLQAKANGVGTITIKKGSFCKWQ